MKNLKKRFEEDPIFAIIVLATAVTAATGALKVVAKTIEASAYAYRASKM